VAILVAASPPTASAVTVTYSTTGTFGNTSTSTSGNLTFVGANGSVNEPTVSSLGTFQASAGSQTFVNTPFTIDIFQLLPGVGTGTLVGSLTGLLNTNQSGTFLTFTSPTASITAGGYVTTYLAFPTAIIPSTINAGAGLGVSTVQGSITSAVIPLPAAAWGGMALFGVLGGAKLRRSRQSVMA